LDLHAVGGSAFDGERIGEEGALSGALDCY
jgi:hypothetical protein